ncbi:uncharacterized protein LOC129765777 [Toxorhynchites rutilus septentrionalis]|uniref:uncharacterized protein LOC129765777 n=1 Tax=Toxorhynchites rutilus septentrionalis TaxID=329112 RepID=UPI00247A841F|nr:uncharacterized protein LOC129765777 [Toxorhynchites rutilus septentrionalis]
MAEFSTYNIASININTITNATKIAALRTFVRTLELDIVFLQEVENEQLSLPNFNVVCNVDHARRGTAIALKDHIPFSDVEKSLDGRLIALRVQNTTLCNVYAPSGTALRAERERFFNDTLAFYLRHTTPHVILAGDFNCVLRTSDSTSVNSSPALQATIQQLQLHDLWVKLYPTTQASTYITHNAASRLDRIYVSTGLCEHIRNAATHSREIFSIFNAEYQRLYAQLRTAYDGYYQFPAMLVTINRVKAQMLSLQRKFAQNFIRINETLVAGENLSTFQLGDRRRKRSVGTELQNERGEHIRGSAEIERHMVQYLADLYAMGEARQAPEENFECERVVTENDETNEAMMDEITISEIEHAIRTSQKRKSPGADGLPIEFYQRTFDVIYRELYCIINEARTEELPVGFTDGIIVLVKKRSGDGTARVYRPISLLNVDYRILSRGDPLSMLLFVIYLHPLLTRLERICGGDICVAYADDITAIITSTTTINRIFGVFGEFELVAGAKLNR